MKNPIWGYGAILSLVFLLGGTPEEKQDPLLIQLSVQFNPISEGGSNSSYPYGTTHISATLTQGGVPVNATENILISLGYSGTATEGTDYTISGTAQPDIQIASGNSSDTIEILSLGDIPRNDGDPCCPFEESPETIVVDITGVSSPSGEPMEDGVQQITVYLYDEFDLNTPGGVANSSGGGGCGLMGVEAVFLLGIFIAFLRLLPR